MNKDFERTLAGKCVFFVIFFLIGLSCQYGRLEQLFFHDEGYTYIRSLFDFVDMGFAAAWSDPNSFFNHPPLMMLFAYPVVKVFGYSPFGLRLAMVAWSAVGYLFMYLLGVELFRSRIKAFFAVIFGLFAPYWFFESHAFFGDTFLLPLMNIFAYYALRGEGKKTFAAGLLAGLARESSVALSFAFAGAELFRKKRFDKSFLPYLGPLLGYILFLLFERIKDGVFMDHAAFQQNDIQFTIAMVRKNFFRALDVLWVEDKRWIICFALAAALIYSLILRVWKKDENFKKLLPLALTAAAFTGFFIFHQGVINRYLNPVHGYLVLMALFPFAVTMKNRYYLVLVTAMTISWNYEYLSNDERSFDRVDALEGEVRKATDYYFAMKTDQPLYILNYPFDFFMVDPRMGYAQDTNRVVHGEIEDYGDGYLLWTDYFDDDWEKSLEKKLMESHDFTELYKSCVDDERCFWIYKIEKKTHREVSND